MSYFYMFVCDAAEVCSVKQELPIPHLAVDGTIILGIEDEGRAQYRITHIVPVIVPGKEDGIAISVVVEKVESH